MEYSRIYMSIVVISVGLIDCFVSRATLHRMFRVEYVYIPY